MSAPVVVAIEPDDQTPGWMVTCSVCGYVCGTDSPSEHHLLQVDAECHRSWHDNGG